MCHDVSGEDISSLSVHGRRVMLTTLPIHVNRVSRQCETLNISQPYRPPQSVKGENFTFLPLIRQVRSKQNIQKMAVLVRTGIHLTCIQTSTKRTSEGEVDIRNIF
jgi:hypothetical protein